MENFPYKSGIPVFFNKIFLRSNGLWIWTSSGSSSQSAGDRKTEEMPKLHHECSTTQTVVNSIVQMALGLQTVYKEMNVMKDKSMG